jgi:tetratricopeptide (TPR) repeat protein
MDRARDIKIHLKPDRLNCVIRIDTLPRFILTKLEGNRIRLTLHNTKKTGSLTGSLSLMKDVVILKDGEGGPPTDLSFDMTLPGPSREIRSTWFQEHKVLSLVFVLQDKNRRPRGKHAGPTPLRKIRFGLHEKYSRLVMDLDFMPVWEVKLSDPATLSFLFTPVSKISTQTQYGPFQNIKAVTLRHVKNELHLSTALMSRFTRTRLFWLRDGKKMVMDLFHQPEGPDEETTKLIAQLASEETDSTEDSALDTNLPTQTTSQITGAKPPGTDSLGAKSPGTDSPSEAHSSSDGEKELRDSPNPGTPPEPGDDLPVEPSAINEGPFVKKRIIKSGGTPAAGDGTTVLTLSDLKPEEVRLYSQIIGAGEIRDYQKAVGLIERFLSRHADSPIVENLLFLRGDYHYQLWKKGAQESLLPMKRGYQVAVGRYPASPKTPLARIRIAQGTSALGNDYEALGHLNLLINSSQRGDFMPLAYLIRGRVFLKTNQLEKAVEDFKKVLDEYPQSDLHAEARFGIAKYFQGMGVYHKAENVLLEIEEAEPAFYLKNPEYLLVRGQNALYLKKYDLARTFFFRALNLGHQTEGNDLLLGHIGDTYHHQSREKEAEKFYRMIMEQYPGTEGASIAELRLAKYAIGVGAFKKFYDKTDSKPLAGLALIGMAKKYLEKKQYVMAMDTLEKFLKDPIKTDMHREAQRLYYRAAEKEVRRLEQAGTHADLVDFFRNWPSDLAGNLDPEVLLKVALAFYQGGLYRESKGLLRQIRPFDLTRNAKGEYLRNLARCHLQLGEHKKAADLLEKHIDKNIPAKDRQEITMMLAQAYENQKRLTEALRLYRSIVDGKRLLPEKQIALAYLNMGILSNRLGRYEKGREALNRCVALSEKSPEREPALRAAFVQLGNGYYEEGRYGSAIDYYNRAVEAGYEPSDGNAYWKNRFRLASCYLETGEHAKAESILNQILEQGDPLLQQKVQVKLGSLDLEKQLKRLPVWSKLGD